MTREDVDRIPADRWCDVGLPAGVTSGHGDEPCVERCLSERDRLREPRAEHRAGRGLTSGDRTRPADRDTTA
jgi:hypothetical protein